MPVFEDAEGRIKFGDTVVCSCPNLLTQIQKRHWYCSRRRETTFFLDVPPTEIEHGYGNRTAPATPCRATWLGGKCRQLHASHDPSNSNPVRAKCEPNICSSDMFGFISGPSISGEAVGSGESSKQLLSNSGGRYQCTSRMAAPAKPKF